MDARGPGRSGRAALAVLALAGVAWAAEPTVKRENGRVWVTGVPDIQMAGDFPRLVGMQILLKHRGEEATLDELMAHSGDAFNLCHATKWELRAGLSIPTDPLSNVARAYGYACRLPQAALRPGRRRPPLPPRRHPRPVRPLARRRRLRPHGDADLLRRRQEAL